MNDLPIFDLSIDGRGILRFLWKQGDEEHITMRIGNRLTKERYFSRKFSAAAFRQITQQGFSCYDNGVPTNVPLEIQLRMPDGEIEYPDCSHLGARMPVYYGTQVEVHKGKWFWQKTYTYLLRVDMPEYSEQLNVPDELIYLKMTSDRGSDSIRLYLPRLEIGENLYWFDEPPEGYSLNTKTLFFNDSPEARELVSMLQLVPD